MHKSSARWARCGKSSLIGRPLSPYCRNLHGDLSKLVVALNCTRGFANGNGLPSSRVNSGFGSNVSTCETPPTMKRKMIRFARAAKCGKLAASGLADATPTDEPDANLKDSP